MNLQNFIKFNEFILILSLKSHASLKPLCYIPHHPAIWGNTLLTYICLTDYIHLSYESNGAYRNQKNETH